MIALAVAVLVTFAGGLYFIAHNKPDESPVLPHQGTKGNGLPPKPEERWRYIKELENRQIGVASPTEPSAGGEIQSTGQLTNEQRQLLEQMQSDMKRQPTTLTEVPYNDQSQMPARTSSAPRPQTVVPIVPNTSTVTPPPAPRTTTTVPAASQHHTTQAVTPPAQTAQKPVQAEPRKEAAKTETATKDIAKTDSKTENAKPEKEQRWMVQCGSFKTSEPAESVRAELAFAGVESRIASSGGWHRIMLGPYNSRTVADKMAQKLKGMGQSNCIPLASGG
ncbi:Cell division protein FtsN [Dickeya solani]|nr:cell division protein FtsN [Dickeya solani IPO 2222]AUC42645.1 Cell division protein FtsN [Dickeya solani RNS 08.23.3.1.A]AUH09329.1 cell division protein FtsN [Dickeya solani D s0432-1]AUH13303.1 cell division protein FtsN [Dickeya solani]AYQ49797.1 Cell division protein FtsN [Dickeya solani]